ncbi:hypothetical protein EVAR_20420_1 [Eumeta japonica]|uniref:Uncharacterized protein n=1 Tax=Eumeta variegata TaxID=151549 RepID=A0A4C1TY91_EUMVA|nr:hypothetical protein EVAR_20420_1 [Eumeta japonica]
MGIVYGWKGLLKNNPGIRIKLYDCRGRKRRKASEQINDGAGTPAAGMTQSVQNTFEKYKLALLPRPESESCGGGFPSFPSLTLLSTRSPSIIYSIPSQEAGKALVTLLGLPEFKGGVYHLLYNGSASVEIPKLPETEVRSISRSENLDSNNARKVNSGGTPIRTRSNTLRDCSVCSYSVLFSPDYK